MAKHAAAVGLRVRMVGVMPGDPDPVTVGDTGTITEIFSAGMELEQYAVDWDSGRRLMLLPGDPFEIIR